MIDLNVTLLIQLVNFVITLILVNLLLIRPILGIMQRRKASYDALNTGIQELVMQVSSELGAYEDGLRTARRQAAELVRSAREDASIVQADMVDTAGAAAATVLRTGREQARSSAEQARKELEPEIPRLADAVLSRLLA